VAVALNVNISYLAPPKMGSRLTAEAREIHCSRKTALYDIRVVDDQGKPIAACQALAYRKGDPLPFL
jgi:acyl-CoA thioesterase